MDAMKDFEHDRAAGNDDAGALPELPAEGTAPLGTDQDERRMQVRAYNFWASLLNGRQFPAATELSPENDTDFGPCSVLLDFTEGMEDPGIAFLGEKLAEQCGIERDIARLEQVPPRTLLTRLTDHYLQIFANRAPIGFEAEFVNQRGETILYRGIMMPLSSNDDTIDFIYGVINWKVATVALEAVSLKAPRAPLSLSLPDNDMEEEEGEDEGPGGMFQPLFVRKPIHAGNHEIGEDPAFTDLSAASLGELALPSEEDMELADWLAQARESADQARSNEDRSRKALYQAVGRAYDFALAATDAPEDYAELLGDAGLKAQARAPLTPLVKLVFGTDYDKTRLTEFATALSHAQRLGLERGTLSRFLSQAEGGLKGVVATERRMRREESSKTTAPESDPRPALAQKLRELQPLSFDTLPVEGDEFALVLARRLPDGAVAMLGEVPHDVPLIEKAARKLVG